MIVFDHVFKNLQCFLDLVKFIILQYFVYLFYSTYLYYKFLFFRPRAAPSGLSDGSEATVLGPSSGSGNEERGGRCGRTNSGAGRFVSTSLLFKISKGVISTFYNPKEQPTFSKIFPLLILTSFFEKVYS